jgi:gas vesicle protein
MKKLMVVVVMALFAWNAQAQKPGVVLDNDPGWQKIGETVASFKSQNESIVVLGADEFAAIKIKVEDAPLEIDRLQVFYESGEMEEIDVKKKIAAGEETEVFRLENPDRDIQKVAFTYNTASNASGEKADVMLFGLKTGNEGKSDAYRDDAERTENRLEETGDDIERESEEVGDDVGREADEAEDEIDESAERTESDLENAADKTGNAISETAAKAAAEIDDDRHDTKVGPDGQAIFISDDSRYYYISERGKRIYVSEWQLKDKPGKD